MFAVETAIPAVCNNIQNMITGYNKPNTRMNDDLKN